MLNPFKLLKRKKANPKDISSLSIEDIEAEIEQLSQTQAEIENYLILIVFNLLEGINARKIALLVQRNKLRNRFIDL